MGRILLRAATDVKYLMFTARLSRALSKPIQTAPVPGLRDKLTLTCVFVTVRPSSYGSARDLPGSKPPLIDRISVFV